MTRLHPPSTGLGADAAHEGQDAYARLVGILRTGQRVPLAEIDGVLSAAGRSDRDLIRDALSGPAEPPAQPGDPCPLPTCPGSLVIYNSKRRRSVQVQYLRCNRCGARPPGGKRAVPALSVRRRPRRQRPAQLSIGRPQTGPPVP